MMSDNELFDALTRAEDDAYYLGTGYVKVTNQGRNGYGYERIDPTTVMLATAREDAKAAASHAERGRA